MKFSGKHVANEFFEILKIPFFVLRVFGIFPFSFVYQGDCIVLQTYSVIAVIVTLLYGGVAYVSTCTLYGELIYLFDNPNFDKIIEIIDEITMRLFLLLLPLYFWRRGTLLAKLFNDWSDYQVNFECLMATQTHFIMSSLKREILWTVLALVAPSSLIGALVFASHELRFEAKCVYFYCISGHSSIVVYWFVSSMYHIECVNIFLETVEVKSKVLNSRQFDQLIALWMQLNNLTEKFHDINSVLFIPQLRFFIINGVIGLYSCYILATDAKDELKELFWGVSLTLACFCCIYIYSEQGYQLEKKINTDMRTQLLNMNLTELELTSVNEIWTLLRTNELKSPAIHMRRYMKLNREFLIAVLVGVVNFLIIFSQIDYSQNLSYNGSLTHHHHFRVNKDELIRGFSLHSRTT